MHAAVLVGAITWSARPSVNCDAARLESRVPSAGRGTGRSDQFDQVCDEREAVSMIRRAVRVAGLTELAHVANGRDGTPAIINAFKRPGGASGVVDGRIQ